MKNVDAYVLGVISTCILILLNSILLKLINFTFAEYSLIIYLTVSLIVSAPTVIYIITCIHSKGLYND